MSSKVFTNQEAVKIYQKYVDGWKPISAAERKRLVTEVIDENVQYFTPQHESGGFQTMIKDMEEFQAKYPESYFDVGEVSTHHQFSLLVWIFKKPDGSVIVKGHDQVQFSSEGKILRLITFGPFEPKS